MNINLDPQDTVTEEVRIEIIPLIDVIFCILTFFILAAVSLTRQQAIGVDLPQATTGTPQMREMLIVSVDSFGQTYIEDQPVTRSELSQILQQYQQAIPEGVMVLYASQSARYADVVEVLDTLRAVGGDRVALATLPESSQPSDPNNFNNLPQPGGSLPLPNAPLNPVDPLNPSAPPVPDSGAENGSLFPLFPEGSGITPDGSLEQPLESAPRPGQPDGEPNLE